MQKQENRIKIISGETGGMLHVAKSLKAVSEETKKGSINRILEMSDEEVALAVLTGKLRRP
jgi:hypothetical protein